MSDDSDRTTEEQRVIDMVAGRRGREWAEEHAELILAQYDLVGQPDLDELAEKE